MSAKVDGSSGGLASIFCVVGEFFHVYCPAAISVEKMLVPCNDFFVVFFLTQGLMYANLALNSV